ncbi:MAG: AI-2E family transporter [Bacteroidaceae bacterium]|nr:AI-2E family transporter [Bacteroidaceae bacterium]
MAPFQEKITFDKFIRYAAVAVIFFLIYLLMRRLSNVLMPFFIAWFLAYLLHPIVCFFQYKCKLKNRILSILVTLLAIGLVLWLFYLLIVPPAAAEIERVKDLVTAYFASQAQTNSFSSDVLEWINEHINIERMISAISFDELSSFVEKGLPKVVGIVSTSLSALVGILASFIAILYMIFILMDYEQMSNGMLKMFPKKYRPFVDGLLTDVKVGMNGYFRGQSIIALCVGILFSIGFLIIDFPMAIPLGLFIGFLNLVPYLQTIGFIPTIFLAMLKAFDTGGNFWLILISALAVFAIVQLIQDAILTPKIMGDVTGLNAAVILLSLSIWGSLLGMIGLIIALPLTTLIVSYYKRYVLGEDPQVKSSTTSKTDEKEKAVTETKTEKAVEIGEKKS